MSIKAKRNDASTMSPSWRSLVLVCKDCRRREDGPKHLKAKALAKEIKHQIKGSAPHTRVVLSGCLKLCPKKATSVACVGVGVEPRIAAIKAGAHLKRNLAALLATVKLDRTD